MVRIVYYYHIYLSACCCVYRNTNGTLHYYGNWQVSSRTMKRMGRTVRSEALLGEKALHVEMYGREIARALLYEKYTASSA